MPYVEFLIVHLAGALAHTTHFGCILQQVFHPFHEGGDIECRSVPGDTTFLVKIPAHDAANPDRR